MPPETLKLLHDMQTAAQDIADSSAGRTYELFLLDKQLRMAIERAFEIVGQALTKLHKIDPSTATSITDWRAIMGFRNVLIHGYAIVDPAKTWDIVQSELPTLRRKLDAPLNPLQPDSSH